MSQTRILLVDDDSGIRDILPAILSSAGYMATIARDGAEALALLHATPGAWEAAIIDLQMPPPDGGELIGAIAASPGRFGLRGIVLYTSEPPGHQRIDAILRNNAPGFRVCHVQKSAENLKKLHEELDLLTRGKVRRPDGRC